MNPMEPRAEHERTLICIRCPQLPYRCTELKEYTCIQVGHHKNVGRIIEEWQKKGWRLSKYQAVGTPTIVNHYLLFEKGE